MKAIVIEHLGDLGLLKEIPVPKPGSDDMLIRVIAAGVNPIDWKRRNRTDEIFPFVAGQDFAGVVSERGSHATKYHEGERIFGIAGNNGAYADYTIVAENDREEPIAKIPESIGDADAAALPTAGLTALAAIDALRVSKGTVLLVLGATGGVGGFAVQIAHDRGAHVIGTGRAAKETFAQTLGINEFIAYDRGDVAEAVKAAHPNGIDAVLDLVDDADAIKKMAAILRAGGAIVSTIRAADVDWFAQRKVAAQNLVVFSVPQFSHAGLRTLLELVEQGRLRVPIAAEYPLADAVKALEESRRGGVDGKLVITVD